MNLRNYLRQFSIYLLLFSLLSSNITTGYPFNPSLLEREKFTEDSEAEKKKLPTANSIRSRKIDVQHIAIDLRFDWVKKQAYGTTAITLAPLNLTDKIALDAAYFTIHSVTSQNGTPLKFDYEGGDKDDNLKITLDRIYSSGEKVTVKIDYRTNWVNMIDPNSLSGSNGKGIRFFEPTSNDPNKPREIWSMGEAESNRYWFPGYDSPNDFRTTELTATVDKKLTVISNGSLANIKNHADGTRTFHWKMDMPYANFLTSFVVGEYVDIKQSYEGVELHNFGYPHEAEAIAATVVRLPDMIKFYSKVTGVKYPYASYSQVFVQDVPWGVAGFSVATQSENMIDDDRTHADFFYLWDGLEAETLASQWFGGYLTCREWSHVWLNRGFARYFDALYTEYKNGHEEFLLYNHLFNHNTYLNDWNSGNRHPIVTQNYENALSFATDNYPYFRGALVLHMLRKYLGEDNWRKAIRNYTKSNANKSVSSEDFRKAVEETTGKSMDWFFNQWLYKIGHPIFVVTKTYDEAKKQLTLKVKQTQEVDLNDEYPQVEFFQGKVEIEIDDKIEHIWLEPKVENVFTFASLQQPKLVNFDYESTWIKELKFEKSLDELLYQLQNDKDILGKRWAMSELAALARDEKILTTDKAKIYAGLQNTVLSNAYWRLRAGAMSQLQNLLAPATNTKPAVLDKATIAMLLTVIKNEKSWNRAAAINFLGMTCNPKFADIYLSYLNDQSDRVINAAATALGKSKSPRAFDALAKLVNKPSWKNQSLMSALNGLKELNDARGFDIAFKALSDLKLHRWRLPTPPIWDLRVFAVNTIVALGKSAAIYPIIFERFKKSMDENDLEGIFNNVLLITILADPRGQEVFEQLKAKFKDDARMMEAVSQYETQFKDTLKKS
jgi:aminopeptidase N